MREATCAELGRLLGVHPSTVKRALENGRLRAQQDPDALAPPEPTNPGQPQLRYPVEEVRKWWPRRPKRGRPRQNDKVDK